MAIKSHMEALGQVEAPLQGARIRAGDASLLAFQLLAWSHLSLHSDSRISLGLDEAMKAGPAGIVNALDSLANSDGLLGMAFSGAPRIAALAGGELLAAAGAASRLAKGGLFKRFSPTEIAKEISARYDSLPTLPSSLTEFMLDMVLDQEPGGASVYCPWETNGQFIGAVREKRPSHPVVAESLTYSPLSALVAVLAGGSTNLVATDPLKAPSIVQAGNLQQFESTVAMPPMGLRYSEVIAEQDIYGRFAVAKATATGLMIQHIAAATKGVAAVVVPNSFLFGPGQDKEVRKQLLKERAVRAVVSLPQGILGTTKIPVALLILDFETPCEQVQFVDGGAFFEECGRGNFELLEPELLSEHVLWGDDLNPVQVGDRSDGVRAAVASVDLLTGDAQLQVDRYVISDELRELKESFESIPTTPLGAVAKIIQPVPNAERIKNPQNLADPDEQSLSVFEVGASDLPQAGYVREASSALVIQPKKRSGRDRDDVFLRPSDVILQIKGSAGKVGIVSDSVPPPGENGWISAQSSVVLRSDNSAVDLRPIGAWLRSQQGRQMLDSITTGAAIPMISIKALRDLPVPVLTAQMAAKAIQALEREVAIEAEIASLREEQRSLADELWSQLMKPASGKSS